jgi:hypothetical protein
MTPKIFNLLGVLIGLLAVCTTASAADNTLGTWKYNSAKSKPAPGVPAIKNLTLTREATDGGVKVTAKGDRADGSKIDNVTDAKYGGNPVMTSGGGTPWDMVAMKQVDANTVTEERSKHGGKYHSTVRNVVSKDGKTITATTKGTDEDGKPFTAVAVFEKQ